MTWVSLKERLPELGQYIMVWMAEEANPGQFHFGPLCWTDCVMTEEGIVDRLSGPVWRLDGGFSFPVTHWMLRPEGPTFETDRVDNWYDKTEGQNAD